VASRAVIPPCCNAVGAVLDVLRCTDGTPDWDDCRCQTWVLTRWRDILAPAPWVPIAGGIGVVVVLDVPEALTAGGLAVEHTRIAPQERLMHGMVERGQGRKKTAHSADPWYLQELQIRFVQLLRRIAWPECL